MTRPHRRHDALADAVADIARSYGWDAQREARLASVYPGAAAKWADILVRQPGRYGFSAVVEVKTDKCHLARPSTQFSVNAQCSIYAQYARCGVVVVTPSPASPLIGPFPVMSPEGFARWISSNTPEAAKPLSVPLEAAS